MRFGRARFKELIDTQLALFERENGDVFEEIAQKLDLYNEADRDEAEELYGDYIDAVAGGTVILADVRDNFAMTLPDPESESYIAEFNKTVARRLPVFAPELENS